MTRVAVFRSLLVLSLGLVVSCHDDGMTSDQRFQLRQQESRQRHELAMARARSEDEALQPLRAVLQTMLQTTRPTTTSTTSPVRRRSAPR